eukprot:6193254-Pleurochrysis_carterae.AAC.1
MSACPSTVAWRVGAANMHLPSPSPFSQRGAWYPRRQATEPATNKIKPLGETHTLKAKQRQRQRGVPRRHRDLNANGIERKKGNQGCDEGRGERKKRRATANSSIVP